MTAIFSFLGSAVFRWVLEKVFGMIERKQDHSQEMDLRKLQEQIDSAAHERNLELLNKQAEFQIKLVEEQHRGAMEIKDADAFIESIRSAKSSGSARIDAWNGGIRPFVASMCVLAWLGLVLLFAPQSFEVMTAEKKVAMGVLMIEFSLNLIGSVLGWYFGTRSLLPGKK